jgi:hypothetical protein
MSCSAIRQRIAVAIPARREGASMSRDEHKITDGAARLLHDGELVLAPVIAAPRGSTKQAAGSMYLGSAQRGRGQVVAEHVDLRLEAPMAVALTPRRLMTLRIGTPIGLGIGGTVTELLSAVPIDDVDSIAVRRLALGYTITLTVRGIEIRLEANAASGARAFAATFDRARTAAV